VDRASDLLRETEAKLRGLVSEAASSGDYTSVVQITAWARAVSELVNKNSAKNKTPLQENGKGVKHNGRSARSSHRPHKAYPQFYRQGEELIRLAWSRREKKEYRHKTPHWALRALIKAIAARGAEGRVFSTDEFLPIQDGAEGVVPNYQAYVGISLLKQTGLIDQHGRQGYSIPRPAQFVDGVEAVWKKLPELSS
jgi:hypothetical protein